jgi:beta-xylosidase
VEAARFYTNPVLDADFADPFVARSGSTYYAYSTNSGGRNIPVAKSFDLAHWTLVGDALPARPRWASTAPERIWAPTLTRTARGYVLFFAAPHAASDRQCIGTAVSTRPEGPFVPSPEPIVCPTATGGAIDPFVYTEDHRSWLLWKSDADCCGGPATLWSQALAADKLTVEGTSALLLTADQSWERHGSGSGVATIESPAFIRSAGIFLLLFSGNAWASADYATGYASCASPAGPCSQPRPSPFLSSVGTVAGPGGASVFTDARGAAWLAYHAWSAGSVGYPLGRRSLRIDRLRVVAGVPVLDGPTSAPVLLARR